MRTGLNRVEAAVVAGGFAVAWIVRWLFVFASPDYESPSTTLDWGSVLLFAAGLAGIGPALAALATISDAEGGTPRRMALAGGLAGIGGVVAAAAHVLDAALEVEWLEYVFLAGALGVFGGLLATMIVLIQGGAGRRYWLVPVATILGLGFFESIGGGFFALGWLPVVLRALRGGSAGTPVR